MTTRQREIDDTAVRARSQNAGMKKKRSFVEVDKDPVQAVSIKSHREGETINLLLELESIHEIIGNELYALEEKLIVVLDTSAEEMDAKLAGPANTCTKLGGKVSIAVYNANALLSQLRKISACIDI